MDDVQIGVKSVSHEVSISAVVIRCGCGHPEGHNGQGETCRCGQPTPHQAIGNDHVCPHPREQVDLETVSFSSEDEERQREWEAHGKAEAEARILAANRGVTG